MNYDSLVIDDLCDKMRAKAVVKDGTSQGFYLVKYMALIPLHRPSPDLARRCTDHTRDANTSESLKEGCLPFQRGIGSERCRGD